MQDWLPRNASTVAGDIDFLFWLVLIITGIAFFVVEIGLVYFIFKYRRREGSKAYYTHGNTTAEVIWTAVPAVTVVILGILSIRSWSEIKYRDDMNARQFDAIVEAKQFEWNITYPGPDRALGTADDFTMRNQLHVQVNRRFQIRLLAEDAIHSFFVPEFRIKQDAVPGLAIPVWFEATEAGEYEIACAELCGAGHYRMRGRVIVHTPDDYNAWLASRSATGDGE